MHANKRDMNKLQIIQNRAMRIILKCDRYATINSMLNCLEFFTVKQFFIYQTFCFIYKIYNNMLPNYLQQNLIKIHTIHNHDTRSKIKYVIKRVNKEATKKSVFIQGLKMFNELPENIKVIESIYTFKEKAKQYVRDKY